MDDKSNIEYNIQCLEQRRRELAKQIEKYEDGQLAWIENELARAKSLLDSYGEI
jgi:hypothetical protein